MTEPVERYLHDVFLEDAQNAPRVAGLALSARRRAGAQRRRCAGIAVGALLAVTGVASWSSVRWDPPGHDVAAAQPATTTSEPHVTGARTTWECPGKRTGGTGGFLGSSQPLPPVEDQVRKAGGWLLTKYPDAELVTGQVSADRKEFLYVLPNGNLVGLFDFKLIPAGWYLEGRAYCSGLPGSTSTPQRVTG